MRDPGPLFSISHDSFLVKKDCAIELGNPGNAVRNGSKEYRNCLLVNLLVRCLESSRSFVGGTLKIEQTYLWFRS